MARLADEEDDEIIKAVFDLCYIKHMDFVSEREIQLLEDAKHKVLWQISSKPERNALLMKGGEDASTAQGFSVRQCLGDPEVPKGMFYGNYCPPDLPPVPSLQQLIEVCSLPFEKQLTFSDVKDDQSRLAMSKEDVHTRLLPLLNENEDLRRGIQVTTYDSKGKEYPMVFKIWVEKIHVLTGGWKAFCNDHKLKMKEDFVTVWMFRNAVTGGLCFVIDSRRLPGVETIKRRRARRN